MDGYTTEETRAAQMMLLALEMLDVPEQHRYAFIGYIINAARIFRGVA